MSTAEETMVESQFPLGMGTRTDISIDNAKALKSSFAVNSSEESSPGKQAVMKNLNNASEGFVETVTSDVLQGSGDSGECLQTAIGNRNTCDTESAPKEKDSGTDILSLPIDALHSVASFLKPVEWYEFGQASSSAHRVCREIVRRVRLHGFRCATEIVASWKLGHLEDARELAALYISEGVPVYPHSLGHSYHTILWRMQADLKQQLDSSNVDVDPFFQYRNEVRNNNGGFSSELTYLETKTLFWMQKEEEGKPQVRARSSSLRSGETTGAQELVERLVLATKSDQELPSRKKKMTIALHQHLLEEHEHAREAIQDQDGAMVTPPVSLSADFYHANPYRRRSHRPRTPRHPLPRTRGAEEMDGGLFPLNDRFPRQAPIPLEDDLFEPPQEFSPFKVHAATDVADVEVYSTATLSTALLNSVDASSVSTTRVLALRFEYYQRKLEKCLSRGDNSGFEECILDFWDEQFPSTSGFHYYDRHTAVPRISCMRSFLTKPCPKSVGIIQCEIERIRTSSRGKGVSVKGRLFPTYEYRLFIRNRPHNSHAESALLEEDDDFARRDTVLLVARNRGRKHSPSAGVVPVSPPKKGSNNYYIHLPSQVDVDGHFKKVNGDKNSFRLTPNGASNDAVISSSDGISSLLGRLQSNFIGTEFQIFTPRLRKSPAKQTRAVYSDDELDYDSAVSSDNNSSRRSRFSRLSLRRTATTSEALPEERTRGQLFRAASSPEIIPGRHLRAKRRAIANTPDSNQQENQQNEMVLCEEEDGVITYTANLLGSRPRIMDVCIPKVSDDGVAGTEWRHFLESSEDSDNCDMLSAFRQVLQRIEQQDQDPAPQDGEDNDEAEEVDDSGLLALQNRPPWWNMELGSFVLNFGGRVSVASVKNFQLCDRHDQDNILLQFGRIQGRHSFTMDFQYPLTAVQAFSIAISSLQSKISFG